MVLFHMLKEIVLSRELLGAAGNGTWDILAPDTLGPGIALMCTAVVSVHVSLLGLGDRAVSVGFAGERSVVSFEMFAECMIR